VPVSKNRRKRNKSGERQKATLKSQRARGNAAATEANLEARLSAVLTHALRFIPPGSIRHQLRFSIRLGHNDLPVDGRVGGVAFGRRDILLVHKDRPLAVLELKRPGLPLDHEDRRQGLSYARLIEPMAPLTIVSNGTETQVFQTYDGGEWNPQNADASTFEKLIRNAAQIGAQDIQNAISSLLGTKSAAARNILSNLSSLTTDKLTGGWDETLVPFAEALLFPRKKTAEIAYYLDHGRRIILLSGPPLVGKSNVLRELERFYLTKDDAVVLYVNASSTRQGLFQLLADTFATELGWNIRQEDARDWLRRMSHDGPLRIIVAIDEPDPDLMGPDLDALASHAFGGRLQLLISCDLGALDKFIRSGHGRQYTPLGREADQTELSLLDGDEFRSASQGTARPPD
jgi:hypothetical protein